MAWMETAGGLLKTYALGIMDKMVPAQSKLITQTLSMAIIVHVTSA